MKFVDGLREVPVEQSHSDSNERPSSTPNSLEPETGIGQQASEHVISTTPRESIQYESNFHHAYDDNAVDDVRTLTKESLRIRSIDFGITPSAFHLDERAENGSCHSQSGSLGPSRASDIGSSFSHSFASPSQVSSSNGRSMHQHRDLVDTASGSGNSLYRGRTNPSVKTSQQLLKYYIDSVAPWVRGILTCLTLISNIILARALQS